MGCLAAWSAPALAQELTPKETDELLRRAEDTYVFGDYPGVVALLVPVVEPEIRVKDPRVLARIYELLGLTHFFIGDREQAETYFVAFAQLEPDRQLDPLVVPPSAVAFYRNIRSTLEVQIQAAREAIERRRQEDEDARRRANTQVVRVDYRQNSRLVAILPFGIGQFQNGDNGWGAAFLVSELIASGLSVAFSLAIENLRQPDDKFRPSEVDRARDLRTARFVSGGVVLALMVGGAIEALLAFEPETKIGRPPVVTPTEVEGSAGLSLSMEF